MSIASLQRLLSVQSSCCHTAMVFVKQRVKLSPRKTVAGGAFGGAKTRSVGDAASEPSGYGFCHQIPVKIFGLTVRQRSKGGCATTHFMLLHMRFEQILSEQIKAKRFKRKAWSRHIFL